MKEPLSKRNLNVRLQGILIGRIIHRLLADCVLHEWGSFAYIIICM